MSKILEYFFKSWTTKIVSNICYVKIFRVKFREQPFWSFGKKLPPEYLVMMSVGQNIAEKVNLRASML